MFSSDIYKKNYQKVQNIKNSSGQDNMIGKEVV